MTHDCLFSGIPVMGFGTSSIKGSQVDNDSVTEVVQQAIECGYRYIDTASVYGNERAVGRAIAASSVDRESFFVTTKVWVTEANAESVHQAFEASLARLNLDYVDLYLIHWPNPETNVETWLAMEELVKSGKVKQIGLSNFRQQDIEQIMTVATIKPYCNQIECHPYFTNQALRDYCKQQAIQVVAWSPLGSGAWSGLSVEEKPIRDSLVQSIADEIQVSPAQVLLRWHYQLGNVSIPKSETPAHIASNLAIFSFELSDEQMKQISDLNRDKPVGGDPAVLLSRLMSVPVPE